MRARKGRDWPMRKLLFVLFLFASLSAQAQDPIFSQFYAAPLQLNPAFAGSGHAPRLGAAYRNQWSGFNNAYRTYAAFYEQSIDRLNSGIGFNLEGDDAGDGILRTTRFSAVYAYRLNITGNLAVKIGVEAGLQQTALDWDRLVFPDQIDPLDGPVITTTEQRPDQLNNTVFDASSGLLLLSDRFWLGLGLKHLNTPRQGFCWSMIICRAGCRCAIPFTAAPKSLLTGAIKSNLPRLSPRISCLYPRGHTNN
jgi:type IX secretion system PorP/SprF family membrane protein